MIATVWLDQPPSKGGAPRWRLTRKSGHMVTVTELGCGPVPGRVSDAMTLKGAMSAAEAVLRDRAVWTLTSKRSARCVVEERAQAREKSAATRSSADLDLPMEKA